MALPVEVHPHNLTAPLAEIADLIVRLPGLGECQERLLHWADGSSGRVRRSVDQRPDRRQPAQKEHILSHSLKELLDLSGFQGDTFLEGIEDGLVEEREGKDRAVSPPPGRRAPPPGERKR